MRGDLLHRASAACPFNIGVWRARAKLLSEAREEGHDVDWEEAGPWDIGAVWQWGGVGRIPLDPDEDALLRSYSFDSEAVSWSRQDELFRHWSPQGDITQLPLLTLNGIN